MAARSAIAVLLAVLAVAPLAGVSRLRAQEGAPPARAPVPDAPAQKTAERLVRDLFKVEYARKKPEDRRALARRLLDQARGTRDDPATRYILFREAWTLAAEGGDHESALTAIEEASALYEMDAIDLQIRVLDKAAAGAGADSWEAIARTYAALADAAVLATRMDHGTRAASAALTQARKTKNVALVARLKAKVEEFQAARSDFPKVESARARLREAPDDEDANLAAGRFTALVLGDWERGLPLLARGADATLRALAARDLEGGTDAAACTKLGDDWWDVAEKEALAGRKSRLRSRAASWYEKALPALSGLTRTRIEARLAEARMSAEASPAASAAPRPSAAAFGGPPGAALVLTLDADTLFQKTGKTYAADRSGHGNHAILVGARPCEGRLGGALAFDGVSAHLEVPAATSLKISGDITLAAWVRPSVDVTRDLYMTIVSKGKSNNVRPGAPDPDAPGLASYTMRLADTAFSFHYRGESPPRWNWYGSSPGVFTAGTWRHVALVYRFGEPDSMRMYVDGEERSGRWVVHGGADRPVANDEPLWIGAVRGFRGDVIEPFDGVIDHLAIYPRALDAAEVEALRAPGAGREAR